MKAKWLGMPTVVGATFLVCGAWLVVNEARIVALAGTSLGVLGFRGVHDLVLVACSALCLTRAYVRREERVAWALIGLGILAWAFGELYYTAVLWTLSKPPIPSPADGGYLLFYPLCLAGLALLVRARVGGLRRELVADGLTMALSVGALSAAIVFQQVLSHDSGTPPAFATSLAYPLMDMILLATVLGALARMGWRADRVWLLVASGILLFWLADSVYLKQTAAGTYQEGSWFDSGWWGGFFLIAVAAWQPLPARPEARVRESARLILVPLLFGVLALGLLVYGCFERTNWLAIGLAAASLVGVMVRLVLTFQQNVSMLHQLRWEALSDPLTGLANRRALMRVLDAFFASAGAGESRLILFDLNGFKSYNDTFGHPAGDALLVRLAAKLKAHVGDGGEAFRIGGDEFCALIPATHSACATQLAEAPSWLSKDGDGYAIGCSCGAIQIPAEARCPSEALRIADHRMYAHKNHARTCAGRRVRDTRLRGTS